MKKALPAIAVSAAGLTWLLHAQGVIDASVAPKTTDAAGSVATTRTAVRSGPVPRPRPRLGRRRRSDRAKVAAATGSATVP